MPNIPPAEIAACRVQTPSAWPRRQMPNTPLMNDGDRFLRRTEYERFYISLYHCRTRLRHPALQPDAELADSVYRLILSEAEHSLSAELVPLLACFTCRQALRVPTGRCACTRADRMLLVCGTARTSTGLSMTCLPACGHGKGDTTPQRMESPRHATLSLSRVYDNACLPATMWLSHEMNRSCDNVMRYLLKILP